MYGRGVKSSVRDARKLFRDKVSLESHLVPTVSSDDQNKLGKGDRGLNSKSRLSTRCLGHSQPCLLRILQSSKEFTSSRGLESMGGCYPSTNSLTDGT